MLVSPQKKLQFWLYALVLVLAAMGVIQLASPQKVLPQKSTPNAALTYGLYEQCLQNNGEACLHLAHEYITGERVPANPDYAKYYQVRGAQQLAHNYHRACRAHDDASCENLVIVLTGGPLGANEFAGETQPGEIFSLKKSTELRSHFVERCDRRRNATACAGAGKLFRHHKKPTLATAFQEKACRLGDWEACALASKSYLLGDGVKVDENKAALLAAQGVEGAIKAFNSLQKK